jgi:hypothetical protein
VSTRRYCDRLEPHEAHEWLTDTFQLKTATRWYKEAEARLAKELLTLAKAAEASRILECTCINSWPKHGDKCFFWPGQEKGKEVDSDS